MRLITFALCILLLATWTTPAAAQDPTPLPTPGYIQEIPLTSGNTFLLERRISYGDIAVFTILLVILLFFLLYLFVRIPRLWT